MYYYLYDDFIQAKRHEKELARIETRLTDLGIAGKISRLALFRDPKELVRDEVVRGVSTIVAVGNDATVGKVLDAITSENVVFGMIPMGSPNQLANLLGVPEGEAACDVLSARIVEAIDVGVVNGKRFMTGLSVPNFRAELTCEGKYRVRAKAGGTLEVRNLAAETEGHQACANPCDGLLESVIGVRVRNRWNPFRRHTEYSVIPFARGAIKSDASISVFADGEALSGTRFDISITPQALKVITGRGRRF